MNLAKYVKPGRIGLDLEASNKASAIGELLEILADASLMARHRLEVPYSLRRDHEHRFPLTGTPHAGQHAPPAEHGGRD